MTPAIPIRFLTACTLGHMDDFPWVDYSHRGQPCATPELKFLEQGSGDEPADLRVVFASAQMGQSGVVGGATDEATRVRPEG